MVQHLLSTHSGHGSNAVGKIYQLVSGCGIVPDDSSLRLANNAGVLGNIGIQQKPSRPSRLTTSSSSTIAASAASAATTAPVISARLCRAAVVVVVVHVGEKLSPGLQAICRGFGPVVCSMPFVVSAVVGRSPIIIPRLSRCRPSSQLLRLNVS